MYLFKLTEDQTEEFKKWDTDHKKKCKAFNNQGALGGRLTFHFTPISIGVIAKVSCVCGEKIDITISEDW